MNVLRIAILDHCRRKKEKSFAAKEVVQQMFPEDWEMFCKELWVELIQLAKDGQLALRLGEKTLSPKELEEVMSTFQVNQFESIQVKALKST